MHELTLANAIGEIAVAALRDQPQEVPWRVGTVRVRVGDLSGVDPEALGFCFEVVRGEWVELAEAALEIQRCPARVRCLSCGQEYEFSAEGNGCPHCRASGHAWLGGRELEVFGVELVEVGAAAT
jgi:hydrogenase nickel incorporation protein HypA/HybF